MLLFEQDLFLYNVKNKNIQRLFYLMIKETYFNEIVKIQIINENNKKFSKDILML